MTFVCYLLIVRSLIMSIECYDLIEHFDYIKKYIPQPFYIPSDSFIEFKKCDDEYVIVTKKHKYSLTSASAKKLVDSLGIKIKLFNNDSIIESNVTEQVLPAINKLFKCFADCFVFYADNDDSLCIIDLNVNNCKGTEGTKYENGPSPWKFDLSKDPSVFTCFSDFLNLFCIDQSDNISVKADDIMSSPTNVSLKLFKSVNNSDMQPMLVFNSKFSNMSGFTEIVPIIYDPNSDVSITYPINYAKLHDSTFEYIWNKKLLCLYNSFDVNDYVSRELSELAASNETPAPIKKFINTLINDTTMNVNQPIKDILNECKSFTAQMKAGKVKQFKRQLGIVLGFCLMSKHHSCHNCGHIDFI